MAEKGRCMTHSLRNCVIRTTPNGNSLKRWPNSPERPPHQSFGMHLDRTLKRQRGRSIAWNGCSRILRKERGASTSTVTKPFTGSDQPHLVAPGLHREATSTSPFARQDSIRALLRPP